MNPPPAPKGFPASFVWGAAAAAYQIEGAAQADGRGLSVWDRFSHTPGRTWEDHHGDVAADHYHRFEEDFALLKSLGLQALRLSIAWPRIVPDGEGSINERGLDFYDRQIDALLAHGIEPWVTLFHWDFPLDLYRQGGWLNRKSVSWFARYTEAVVDRLSDRVAHWMTLNEPQCFIGLGHRTGEQAPGDKLNWPEVVLAGHHALLAHGHAVSVIRDRARQRPIVGWAPTGPVAMPFDPAQPSHVDAARQHMFAITEPSLWSFSWFADPAIHGHYPEDGLRVFGPALPRDWERDTAEICQTLDFFGANIYHGGFVSTGPDGNPVRHPRHERVPHTLTFWPVTPSALRWGPRFLHERYGLPIVITENGMSGHDWVSLDGAVHDPHRIDYMQRYLRELHLAISDGVPVSGYFAWSWIDNFEWTEGYKHRFGLIHVDFDTLVRTPKDSAHWYAKVISTHGACL